MKKLFNWYLQQNVFIKFLPFLFAYLLIIVVWKLPATLNADEPRYLMFARNLLFGYYSPPYPDVNLWNGPGYPLFITPFLAFKLPLLAIRLANGFLLYFTLVLVYKSIIVYCDIKTASISVIFLGSFFPAFQMLRFIHTETLTWLLISLVCYLFIKYLKTGKIINIFLVLTAFSIAILAMVKVIFGYVILSQIIFLSILFLFPKFRKVSLKPVLVFVLAMVFCLPYLFYTYKLTNKNFVWANSGGLSLYTMSSPYPEELGDWDIMLYHRENDADFFEEIKDLKPMDLDQALQTKAIQNIKTYPLKYLKNWFGNLGRLFLGYPFSYKTQNIERLVYIIPSMFVLTTIILTLLLYTSNFKYIPSELHFLLLFFGIYLIGSSFLSAYVRMFYITLPFWILFVTYIFYHTVEVKKLAALKT